jgi:AraC-like DNA-binding protein
VSKEIIRLPTGRDGAVWRGVAGARWPRHRHDELELNLMVRGRVTYLIGDRRVTIERDHLLLLFPSQEHLVIEDSPNSERWIAIWSPAAVRRLLGGARAIWSAAEPPEATHWKLDPRRARALAGICATGAAAADDDTVNACLGALLLGAWEAATSAARGEPGPAVHPAVEAAARRLRASPDLDGAALARAVGLSRSRLSRLFRAHTGVALAAYRNRLRLERARELLRGGGRNLLEVALAAGFGSYAQFHRVVRAQLGVGPRELAHD